jgi:hypothetical protein
MIIWKKKMDNSIYNATKLPQLKGLIQVDPLMPSSAPTLGAGTNLVAPAYLISSNGPIRGDIR